MKSISIMVILIMLSCLCGQAQYSSINLNNFDPSPTPVYYLTLGTRASGPDFYVQLLGGPVGGLLYPISNSRGESIFSLLDGQFDGGYGRIAGVLSFGYADLKVLAWHGAASYDTAVERVESALISDVKVGDDTVPDPPFPSDFPFPTGLVIVPIPEPAVVGLMVCGAALLILFRRRRKADAKGVVGKSNKRRPLS